MCVCFCAAEGKPPGAPSGISVSEIDRTYVVLSWKAPAYSSKAPMWYFIEKVTTMLYFHQCCFAYDTVYYLNVYLISVKMHVKVK